MTTQDSYFYFQIHKESENVNRNLVPILNAASEIREYNSKTERRFNEIASSLFPSEALNKYFHYDGSLTVPPCTEGIKWHVVSEPIYEISFIQLQQLTLLQDKKNQKVTF